MGRPTERQEQEAASAPCPLAPSTHLEQCCCSSWGLVGLFGEKLGLPAAGVPSIAAYPEQESSCNNHSSSYSYRVERKITKESPKIKRRLKSHLVHPPLPLSKAG